MTQTLRGDVPGITNASDDPSDHHDDHLPH